MPRTAKAKPRPTSGPSVGRLVLFGGLAALVAWVGIELWRLPSGAELAKLKTAQVKDTAMMRARVREAAEQKRKLRPRQQWVELDRVSRPAITAVLTSEDARFFSHGALDLRELNEALQDSLEDGKPLRGASTLTQQVAKNLYLTGDRSFLRKAREAWLAWRLEETLPKRRILRLYLNIAEWGDGVFGIEAAAQTHLKKRALDLTLGEGAALAAMLPNPRRFTPQQPAILRRRAEHVLQRCLEDHVATAQDVALAQEQLDAWLGPLDGKKPEPEPAPE